MESKKLSINNQENSVMPKILFIMPYFGEWPFWMPFYIRSCSYNPTINWLFYTDCERPDDSPPNMEFRNLSYKSYCQLVSDKLGIEFSASNPYKLCDIRPGLGYIHSEDLEGYDFWAFGDIDVIYGNLRSYFTGERLSGKDLLSTHARRVSGHLCIIRNSPNMLNAFRDIPDWEKRFSDATHHALDEGAFSRLFMGHKNWPDWLRLFAEKFKSRSRRSEFVEAHSTYSLLPDGRKKTPEAWYWNSGTLTNTDFVNKELPYLHFYRWKKQSWSGKGAAELVQYEGLHKGARWRISKNGFEMDE